MKMPIQMRLSWSQHSHDGAYKGWVHVIVPFIGKKNGNVTA